MVRLSTIGRAGTPITLRTAPFHRPLVVKATAGGGRQRRHEHWARTTVELTLNDNGSGQVVLTQEGKAPLTLPWPDHWGTEPLVGPATQPRYRAEVDFIEV